MAVNLQEERLRVEDVVGERTVQAQVGGMLELPKMQPEITRVLEANAQVQAGEVRTQEGRVIVSGSINFKLLYTAEVGDPQQQVFFAVWENVLPFEQMVEISEAQEGHKAYGEFRVEDVDVDIRGPRDLQVDLVIAVETKVVVERQLEVATDAVAIPPEAIRVDRQLLRTDVVVGEATQTLSLEEMVIIPKGEPPVTTIVDTRVTCRTTEARIINDKVVVEGICDVKLLYAVDPHEAEAGPVYALDLTDVLPFQAAIDLPGAEPGMDVLARLAVVNAEAEVESPREVELDLVVEIEVKVTQARQLQVVTDITSLTQEIVEVRKELLRVEAVIREETTSATLQEILQLPADRLPIERVLRLTPSLKEVETRVMDGRVLVEGDFDFDLLYVANDVGFGDSTHPVHFFTWKEGLSFEQAVPAPGAKAGMQAHARVTVVNVASELAGPMTLRVRLVVELLVKVTASQQLEVVVEVTEVRPPCEDGATYIYYIVQPGDTLWKISRRYGTTVDAIVAANQIPNPDLIMPGQRLLIPCGRQDP